MEAVYNELLTALNKNGLGLEFTHASSFPLGNFTMPMDTRFHCEKIDAHTYTCRIDISNNTSRTITLYSSVVLELKAHISKRHHLHVLRNGWQNISPTYYRQLRANGGLQELEDISRNPFSYKKEYGYLRNAIVSEWFSEITNAKHQESIAIGAITNERYFSQVSTRYDGDNSCTIRLVCQNDAIGLSPGESIASETFVITLHEHQYALDIFAKNVCKKLHIEKSQKVIHGICCSYYTDAADHIHTDTVINHIDFLAKNRNRIPLDYIQIDAGYCRWGDWTSRQDNNIREIITYIQAKGFQAGLWIGPLGISRHAHQYPLLANALLKDKKGKPVRIIPLHFARHFAERQTYTLDPTHPLVQEYIQKTIKTMVSEWGVKLLKIDFLSAPAFALYNFHQKGTTRLQAIRQTLQLIRNMAGDDCALLLGIAPLQAAVGEIDFCRISNDATFPYVYHIPIVNRVVNQRLIKSLFRSVDIRGFLGKYLWINDFDCIVTDTLSGLTTRQIAHRMTLQDFSPKMLILGDDLLQLTHAHIQQYIMPLFARQRKHAD